MADNSQILKYGRRNVYATFQLLLTLCSVLLQLGFAVLTFKRAYKDIRNGKKWYNLLTGISMVLYLISALPLLLSAGVTLTEITNVQEILVRMETIKHLNYMHNVFVIMSTFFYTLIIQIRFQGLQALFPHAVKWDYLWIALTVTIWAYLGLYGTIIVPFFHQGFIPIAYGAMWSIYVLLVDTGVALATITKLVQERNKIMDFGEEEDVEERKSRYKTIFSLILIMLVSWLSLVCALLAAFVYNNDADKRGLVYRIGFCFSVFLFIGAFVFINSIPKLVLRPNTKKNSLGEKPSISKPPRLLTKKAALSFGSTDSGSTASDKTSVNDDVIFDSSYKIKSSDPSYAVWQPPPPLPTRQGTPKLFGPVSHKFQYNK
ncbi:hypothetical protein BC833DRAFT_568814 [Globomyces pollinis-pini]|nr:hypothetical protein BC833DRAFT_568814 [Globomyces pollinis-pini]